MTKTSGGPTRSQRRQALLQERQGMRMAKADYGRAKRLNRQTYGAWTRLEALANRRAWALIQTRYRL